MRRWVRHFALILILTLGLFWFSFTAVPVYAQGQLATASLTGRVTDETGAVIPGAQLSLQPQGGGATLTTTANEEGYYRFSFLRPGTYILTAKNPGFSDVVISNIVLNIQQTASIDITMKVGEITQEVNVSASTVAIESQSSSLGGIVDERINKQLPLILRDPTQLVRLVPGVVADHRQTTAADSSGLSYQGRLDFTINGGYRAQAVAMIDGVDVTIKAGSFSSIPIQPTPDFTEEFRVQTNNLSSEFGGGAGVLNIVTKSGTNKIHGSVFEFLQNDNLNANDFFNNRAGNPKPESKRNQFGFAVGGPVIKNKTFWFVNWEGLRQKRFLPVRTRVPTEAEKAGIFQNTFSLGGDPITIYNPFDLYVDPADGKTKRRPFPNNTIPTSMLNAFGRRVLDFYPSPNNPGLLDPNGRFTGINNLSIAGSAPLNWDRFDVKIDHHHSSAHRFMWRFSRHRYRVIPLDVFKNPANPQSLSTRDNDQPGYNSVLSWTWTASPTLVIQQAGNWARITDDSNQPRFDPTQLGGPFADGRIVAYAQRFTGGPAFPNITVAGYAPMGNGFGNNFKEPFSNYQYSLGITKTLGRHTLKSGFQFIVLQAAEDLFKGFGGSYNFSGRWTCGPDPLNCSPFTGNGLADLLLGLPAGGAMNAGFTSIYTSKYYAWYFQDDFRLTPRLTLNLGARYDITTPYTERFNHMFRFDPIRPNPIGDSIGPNTNGKSLNQYFIELVGRPLTGAVIFPSSPGVNGRGMVPVDLSNFAPRLGFAYQITKNLVVRGGISKFYMLNSAAPGPSTPGNGTFGAATNIVSTIDGINPITTIDNPFPAGFNEPTYDKLGLLSLLGDQVWGGSTGQVTPYQWQWNFGFQYALTADSLLSVAYAGSRGHRLTCAFFFCGDQIPRDLVRKFGPKIFETVPNPFFGIITNPLAPLSLPRVQFGQLLKQWPAYTNWVPILPPWHGPDPDHDTFQNAFESLQVQFQQRYSRGLSLLVAYTASKNLTNSDSFEAGYLGPSVGYQNLIDFKAERSLAADDVAQKLVIGHVYDLPLGRGRRFGSNWPSVVDKVLGQWQLSGMIVLQSGFPLPIGITAHRTGGFGGGARPNLIGNPCLDPGRPRGEKIQQYLNPAAFAKPPDLEFGNAPRLLNCRGDGIKNYDFALNKFIPFRREEFKLEIRAEFYNVFNRPQLGRPNTTFLSGAFGQIFSQANAPRIIQFGLKVNF